jgi:hypothetical protein
MKAAECRERARECRVQAGRAWGKLHADFLSSAAAWEALGDHLEKLEAAASVAIVIKAKRSPSDA